MLATVKEIKVTSVDAQAKFPAWCKADWYVELGISCQSPYWRVPTKAGWKEASLGDKIVLYDDGTLDVVSPTFNIKE